MCYILLLGRDVFVFQKRKRFGVLLPSGGRKLRETLEERDALPLSTPSLSRDNSGTEK